MSVPLNITVRCDKDGVLPLTERYERSYQMHIKNLFAFPRLQRIMFDVGRANQIVIMETFRHQYEEGFRPWLQARLQADFPTYTATVAESSLQPHAMTVIKVTMTAELRF